jgi:CRP-like cAMP-binding protein
MPGAQTQAARFLGKIPLFRQLDDDELYEIVRILRPQQYAEGKEIFKQGQEGSSAYIIESGRVEIRLRAGDRTELLATLGKHDVLGELALIDPAKRSATATAVEPTMVYEIAQPDFKFLLEQLHPAAYKVVRQLSVIIARRIRGVNQRIEAYRAPGEIRESLLEKAALGAAEEHPERPVATDGALKSRDSFVGKVSVTFRWLASKFWQPEGAGDDT